MTDANDDGAEVGDNYPWTPPSLPEDGETPVLHFIPGLAHERQDWAPYMELEPAVRAYIRDADAALDALTSITAAGSPLVSFTCDTIIRTHSWGESLWQEVAATDGLRLILWHGEDEFTESGLTGFNSNIRTIPLTAIIDQGLMVNYYTYSTGARAIKSAKLYLSTATPERAVATVADRVDEFRVAQYVETYRFSKSVADGGRAQIERLIRFAHVLSKFAAK